MRNPDANYEENEWPAAAVARANGQFYSSGDQSGLPGGPTDLTSVWFRVAIEEDPEDCTGPLHDELCKCETRWKRAWEEPYVRWGDAVARRGDINRSWHDERRKALGFKHPHARIIWPRDQHPGSRGFYDPKRPLPIYGKSERERRSDWARHDDRFGWFVDWSRHQELWDLVDHEMNPEDTNYQDVCDILGEWKYCKEETAQLDPRCTCKCEFHGALHEEENAQIDAQLDGTDEIDYYECACHAAHFLDIDLGDLQAYREEAWRLFDDFCVALELDAAPPHRCSRDCEVRRIDAFVETARQAGVIAMRRRIEEARCKIQLTEARAVKFTKAHISDAKRIIRGENYLAAQGMLRARDNSRTAPWRVMILAGGSPEEEIGAIRAVMPNAVIVAVDRDPACVAKALAAGANDGVVVHDVLRLNRTKGPPNLPEELEAQAKFDVINLDMCCTPSDEFRRALGVYARRGVTARGVLMVTFSYGHDVAERFIAEARGGSLHGELRPGVAELMEDGFSEALVGRVLFLQASSRAVLRMRSVVAYPGHRMPMCSILFEKGGGFGWDADAAWQRIGNDDLEHGVLESKNIDKLYATPAVRIAQMRRAAAARKAVATRRARTVVKEPLS